MKISEICSKLFVDETVSINESLGIFLARILGQVNYRKFHSITHIEKSSKDCQFDIYPFCYRMEIPVDFKCENKASYRVVLIANGGMFSKYYCDRCLKRILFKPLTELSKVLETCC